MKRESGFNRVLGVSPEDEEEVLKQFKGTFDSKFEVQADGQSIENEKSPELINTIEGMTRYMHGFLREYGVTALDIRPDQVHFIDKEKAPKDVGELSSMHRAGGVFSPLRQWIFIFYKEGRTGLKNERQVIAHSIAHEMIHFNSFSSLQMKPGTEEEPGAGSIRRLGLVTESGRFSHFNSLNEAVTEELAIRFSRKYLRNLDYTKSEVEKLPNDDFYDLSIYNKERADLILMIRDIFEANKDKFSDKEEIFNIFVQGMLKGRLLPLARLIDKTYGRGRFSELADEMRD